MGILWCGEGCKVVLGLCNGSRDVWEALGDERMEGCKGGEVKGRSFVDEIEEVGGGE